MPKNAQNFRSLWKGLSYWHNILPSQVTTIRAVTPFRIPGVSSITLATKMKAAVPGVLDKLP